METIIAYDQTLASREFQFLENLRLDTKRNETSALNHVRREVTQEVTQQRDEHWEGVVAQEKAEKATLAQTVAQKDQLIADLMQQLATR